MTPSITPYAAGPLSFWIRPDGRLLNASEAVCRWLGYSLDALKTMHVWDIDPDFSRDRWPLHWRELRAAGSLNFITHHHHRNGAVSEVEVFAHYLALGAEECVSATAYPLSPEQRAERALRESEARLLLALEVSGQALYELNLITGKALLSEAYVDLLERDPNALEVDLDEWLGWVHPEDRDVVLGLYQECVSGQRSEYKDVDFRWRSGSGVYKWLRSVGRVVERDETGRPLRLLGTHLDITDRIEAEESLRLNQIAIDRAALGVYWFDSEGTVLNVNDEVCRSLGYSREQLVGGPVERFDPHFTPPRYAELWDVLRTSGSATFEAQPYRSDGVPITLEVTCNYISLGDKEYNITFARDITARKEAEDALRMTQLAVDRAVVGIYWFDAEGRLVYVNDEACRSLGYTREELIGAAAETFDPDYDAERYGQLWDELRRSGGATTFETRHRRKDGSLLDCEVVCNYISVGDKEYNVAFARDITEKKAAETKLKDSELRYRAVFDNSLDAIIVHDIEGGILAVNQAMLDMFRLEHADALGCTIPDLSGPEHPKTGPVDFWRRTLAGEHVRFEWTAKQPRTGVLFPVEVTLRKIQFGGQEAILANVRDISERKRAEEALRRSEERFATAFRWSPAPTTISDLETHRFIDVNDRWLSATGYARDEVIGHTVTELGHVADPALIAPAYEQINKRGVLEDYPVSVVRKDGESRDYLWSAERIQLRGRDVLLSALQDVTERNRAQTALRQSEERFAKAFQSSPVAMLISSIADGRIIDVNERWLKTLSFRREEMIGRTTKEIGIWNDPSDRDRMIAQLRKTGPFQDEPIVILTSSGERREILWSTEIIELGTDAVLLSSVHDLTRQKRAERALHESEARLRTAVESIPFDFYVLDAERRFILQNTVSKNRVGDLTGQPPSALPLDQDLLDHFEDMLGRVLAGALVADESQLGQGEEARYFQNAIAPVMDEGRVRGVVGLSIDITERRRADAELRQYREHLEELVQERTEALQQAMRQLVQAEKLAALGNLVAGVAHELNTPLGNARMVSSTLGEQMRELGQAMSAGALRRSQLTTFLERGQEAVELLERNTIRAADLIGHFKEIAVDQTSVRRRRFNLLEMVNEVLATMRPTLKRTAHRIDLDIPSDLELDSYPGPLEQVIANLVDNSLRHGLEGIEAGLIRIRAGAADSATVQLTYSDDGVGIPPEDQKRVFEPFFTTRLGQGGSGLGLYIVYNLVSSVLGGRIAVSSTAGEGATFTIRVPREAPDQALPDHGVLPTGQAPRIGGVG